MEKRKYKVVSLFSGAMGLDLGLENCGRFELLACLDKEPAVCKTIKTNYKEGRLPPNLKIFEGDINEVSPEKVLEAINLKPGEVDLLVGGPPCQAFSTAGKRQSTQDPRGTLLWQFLRFVEVLQPKFFLMENVRGLLSAALKHRPIAKRPEEGGKRLLPEEEKGSVVRLFADDLQKIPNAAYHMDIFEVNAVNYGAPQIRERVFFIGNRYNAIVDFPNPTHRSPFEEKAETSLFEPIPKPMPTWKTLKDAIGDLSEADPVIMDFSPRKKSFLEMVPPGSNWRSLPAKVQQESMGRAWHAKGGRSGWWRRLSFDLPSPTLVTMPNHASTALCHPTETRALTLREYARIQEFPDDWEVCGKPSEQYAQVGNAVPLRLGRIAGDVISAALDKICAKGFEPYKAAPENYRVIYVQSHIRTRQWYKNGKTILWKDGAENVDAGYSTAKTKRKSSVLG